MTPLKDRILVKADLDQKQAYTFPDGSKFFLPPRRQEWETNGRLTNPVVAEIVSRGTSVIGIEKGDLLVLHHNILFDESYKVYGFKGLSSIPQERWLMAKVGKDGNLIPINGNLVCERIPLLKLYWDAPNKYHSDRVRVISSSSPIACPGDIVSILKYADYEVVYQSNGIEHKHVVVWEEDVTGKIQNEYMKPLHDRVLVKPDEEQQVTEDGFLIPDTGKEKPKRGLVIASGPGYIAKETGVFVPNTVKVGDRVYYGRYNGAVVNSDGVEYLIMKESEILLIE